MKTAALARAYGSANGNEKAVSLAARAAGRLEFGHGWRARFFDEPSRSLSNNLLDPVEAGVAEDELDELARPLAVRRDGPPPLIEGEQPRRAADS
jgi:hypothetical protein